jgi:hypothetical protein
MDSLLKVPSSTLTCLSGLKGPNAGPTPSQVPPYIKRLEGAAPKQPMVSPRPIITRRVVGPVHLQKTCWLKMSKHSPEGTEGDHTTFYIITM